VDTEEETMVINVTDTAAGEGPFATTTGGERTLLLLLATREAREIQRRAQEEAAIDAEDFLTQAEEACAVDPIG
jgi:hypothetical protein